MTLFEECLKSLKSNVIILSKEETKKIFDKMTSTCPITLWGRIDWEHVRHLKKIKSINDIDQFINTEKKEVYILWDEGSLPAIKTNIDIITSIDIIFFIFYTSMFLLYKLYSSSLSFSVSLSSSSISSGPAAFVSLIVLNRFFRIL